MAVANKLRASERLLHQWNAGVQRARYDYENDQHLLSDMLNDWYFGNCWSVLRKGDYIWITDAEDNMCVVRVDLVDGPSLTVQLSTIENIKITPVIHKESESDLGVAYRWRGPRGGGHCIVSTDGVVAIDFVSKEDAENAIAVMRSSGEVAAPKGHGLKA